MAALKTPSNDSFSDTALLRRLCAAVYAHSSDASLRRRARHLQARCLIGIGGESLLLVVEAGKLSWHDRLRPLTPWDFAICGTAQAWGRFWNRPPPPGWHDLLALCKRKEMRIEGSLQPLMANLQYFKDLLALPRLDEHGRVD